MLKLEPAGPLVFNDNQKEHNLQITNLVNEPITFRLQSTVFNRFQMTPRWGHLKPLGSTKVNIGVRKGVKLSPLGRDRVQVVCMHAASTPVDVVTTSLFWRKNIVFNPCIEMHQMCCYHLEDGQEVPPTPVALLGKLYKCRR